MSKTKDILKNIINDFSVDKFTNLFREKSQKFKPHKTVLDGYNDEDFDNVLLIGKIDFDDGELSICAISVNHDLSEKSGKKKQYEKGKKILKDTRSDAGIFIFYDRSGSFRFSLIYADYQGTHRNWSSFKRFTYFVGSSFTNRTFIQRIGEISFSSIASIKEAFSVEKVTKEFYDQVSGKFFELLKEIEHPLEDDTIKKEFIIRIIGRILFLWFLKKKRSINGVPLIPEAILSSETTCESKNYYHMVLEPLFFQILNTPVNDRRLDFFGKAAKILQGIPFLNGGLFEPHEHDYYEPGEFLISKYINILKVPDDWLKSLFELLESYNFTIDENTTVDAEVSIDPEMLGKIFENLLAEINPETGKTAKKSTGGYYTPRSIVEYMVNESLKEYLISITGLKQEKILSLLSYSGDIQTIEITDVEKDKIIDALDTVKIIDPACGSGAFVIGILNKILLILQKIDPESKKWLKKKLGKIDNQLLRKDLEVKLAKENWDYIHKLGIIQGSIYGVDIQPVAVEIAKLRCFLSLIVDEKIDDNADNRGIIPLPNLEFKFVAADSIIGLPKKESTGFADFSDENSGNIEKLKKLRMEYFIAYGNRKKEIEREFAIIQKNMMEQIIKWKSVDDTHTQKLSEWQPFNYAQSSWFDPEWMFGVTDGFDIVIGNPPYIDSEMMIKKGQKIYRDFISKTFAFTKGNWDIYIAFFELGFNILKTQGILTFITPDKCLSKPFGDEFRKHTIDKIYSIIKVGRKIFKDAKVDAIVSFFIKKGGCYNLNVFNFINNQVVFKCEINKKMFLPPFAFDFIFSDYLSLLKKIEAFPDRLVDSLECKNACATSDAYKLKILIKELSKDNFDPKKQLKIINTGTIGKYNAKWGRTKMTYLKDKYLYPVVDRKIFLKQFNNSYSKKSLQSKIIIKSLTLLDACLDSEGIIIPGKSTLIIAGKDINQLKFILAIINSKLAIFYIKERYPSYSYNEGINFTKDMINNFPLPQISEYSRDVLIGLVDKILDSIKDDDHLQNPDKSNKMREYSRQIDKIVYELYGLTKEEVSIIEDINHKHDEK